MKYYLQSIKTKHNGEIHESVKICEDDENPQKVMSGEELISSKEISKEKAIELCGKEAVEG